jgi:RNase P/RNase MRP subunit p30
MREYIDLHIHLKDPQMLQNAIKLGFQRIASDHPQEHPTLDISSRLDLNPKNSKVLLNQLKKHRWNYEVISVICYNKKIARQAGKDHRVDVIKYPLNSKTSFDRQQASLMKNTGAALQVDTIDLLEKDTFLLMKNIQRLKKQSRLAAENGIPLIISSGAYEKHHMREPRGLAALAGLLGIEEEDALDMISVNPKAIVEKNRAKLSDKFIMPNVWRI